MKFNIINIALLCSLINAQNEALETDIIEYGYNYTGELKDGKRNGKGKYTYQNGDVYEGMWSDDVKGSNVRLNEEKLEMET